MNKGIVKGNNYIKYVTFSSAVLWKDKQLSLPPTIFDNIKSLKEWHFIDIKKNEVWVFKTANVIPSVVLKKVGQETQYYFPISMCDKLPLALYHRLYNKL